MKKDIKGFTLVDVTVAVVIFSIVSLGAVYAIISHKTSQRESTQALRQSEYTTFQAAIALEGIDPSKVFNPLQAAVVTRAATGGLANFEASAVVLPTAARTSLTGSSPRAAIAYNTGGGNFRGTGFGYAVQAGGAPVVTPSVPLSAPVFRIYGDISSATFPINSVANLPPTNPPGTFYRYTTDGTTPTTSSSLWNNNPAWTPLSFPAQVTLRAFHSDPQYSPSAPVSASYTFVLSVALTRADGRLSSLNTFTLPELSSPNLNGIVLTSNITGTTIRFTLDGTDPRVSGTAYSGAFAPPAGLFAPTVNLKTVAVSTDPRYTSSAISIYQLAPQSTSLPVPVIVTDNSSPLDAGTPVNIAYNYAAGSTRTAINATPNGTSSTARSFPIN